jgi:hypothetical protein
MQMEITREWIIEQAKLYDQEPNRREEREKEENIRLEIGKLNLPLEGITYEILKNIVSWKAARVKGYIKEEDNEFIKEVTRIAFSTQNERLKLEILTLLEGVSIRMASAILMFCYPEEYTVMDVRALDSLVEANQLTGKIKVDYDNFKQYNQICHRIAKENGVPLRTLDKALWHSNYQKSKKGRGKKS